MASTRAQRDAGSTGRLEENASVRERALPAMSRRDNLPMIATEFIPGLSYATGFVDYPGYCCSLSAASINWRAIGPAVLPPAL
jgi:hypothetical protein